MAETPTARARSLRLFFRFWDLAPDASNRTRGMHWAKRARRAKLAKAHALVAIASIPLRVRASWPMQGRSEIRATAFLGPRRRELDPDNAVAALKPLVDALVFHGVLRNDTRKDVRIPPVRFVSASERQPGDVEGVEIIVLEILES